MSVEAAGDGSCGPRQGSCWDIFHSDQVAMRPWGKFPKKQTFRISLFHSVALKSSSYRPEHSSVVRCKVPQGLQMAQGDCSFGGLYSDFQVGACGGGSPGFLPLLVMSPNTRQEWHVLPLRPALSS